MGLKLYCSKTPSSNVIIVKQHLSQHKHYASPRAIKWWIPPFSQRLQHHRAPILRNASKTTSCWLRHGLWLRRKLPIKHLILQFYVLRVLKRIWCGHSIKNICFLRQPNWHPIVYRRTVGLRARKNNQSTIAGQIRYSWYWSLIFNLISWSDREPVSLSWINCTCST